MSSITFRVGPAIASTRPEPSEGSSSSMRTLHRPTDARPFWMRSSTFLFPGHRAFGEWIGSRDLIPPSPRTASLRSTSFGRRERLFLRRCVWPAAETMKHPPPRPDFRTSAPVRLPCGLHLRPSVELMASSIRIAKYAPPCGTLTTPCQPATTSHEGLTIVATAFIAAEGNRRLV